MNKESDLSHTYEIVPEPSGNSLIFEIKVERGEFHTTLKRALEFWKPCQTLEVTNGSGAQVFMELSFAIMGNTVTASFAKFWSNIHVSTIDVISWNEHDTADAAADQLAHIKLPNRNHTNFSSSFDVTGEMIRLRIIFNYGDGLVLNCDKSFPAQV